MGVDIKKGIDNIIDHMNKIGSSNVDTQSDSYHFLLHSPCLISQSDLNKRNKHWSARFRCKTHSYNLHYNNGAVSLAITYDGLLPEGLTDLERAMFSKKKITKDGKEIDVYTYFSGATLGEEAEENKQQVGRKNNYYADKPRIFDKSTTYPKKMTIDELAGYISKNSVVFYTGAGISMSSGICDMNGLTSSLGINQKKDTDNFVHLALTNHESIFGIFAQFCDKAFNGDPTPAHYSLATIAQHKKTQIITENFDRLQERTGVEAYHVHGGEIQTFFNPKDFAKVNAIVCIGLSHDDRGFLGRYKNNNTNAKIIGVNLTMPNYLGDEDYFVQGDLQNIIPDIEEKLFNKY